MWFWVQSLGSGCMWHQSSRVQNTIIRQNIDSGVLHTLELNKNIIFFIFLFNNYNYSGNTFRRSSPTSFFQCGAMHLSIVRSNCLCLGVDKNGMRDKLRPNADYGCCLSTVSSHDITVKKNQRQPIYFTFCKPVVSCASCRNSRGWEQLICVWRARGWGGLERILRNC